MWVRFCAAFAWPPMASAHRAYKPGMRCNLPAAGAVAAIAQGKAEAVVVGRDQARALARDPYWTGDLAP